MNRWQLVPLSSALGKHAAQWDALNARAFGGHPMLASSFINRLLLYFGDGQEQLCTYAEHGQVRAMCILKRRNNILWTTFLPAQCQIGPTLIPDAALLPSLLSSLPALVLQLDLLCNDPDVGGVLQHAGAHRRNHALTMNIALDGSFDQYWLTRSRRLQSNMRRYEKRLVSEGITQRYVQISRPEEMQAAVERYAQLEGAGWKGAAGSALASSQAQLKFYLEVMSDSATYGRAHVHELWFGDELAASRLILSHGATHVMLKTTYAEKFAPYAPGRLLLRAVIHNAFSSQWGGTVEFCTDAAPDLLGWGSGQRWVQHASLYRSPVARKLMAGMRVLRNRRSFLRDYAANASQLATAAFTHPESLPADAQRLMDRDERNHAQFGTCWYRDLVDTVHSAHDRICIYTLRRNDKILAVLPLRAEKVFLGWCLHSLCSADTTLFEPVLERGLKAFELGFLLTAIQRDFGGQASFKLAPMNPGSDVYQSLLDALSIVGWHPFEYKGMERRHLCAAPDAKPGAHGHERRGIVVHNASSVGGLARMLHESMRRLIAA